MTFFSNIVKYSCIGAAAIILSACNQTTVTEDINSSYSSPNSTLVVCSGYGCILKDKFQFTTADEELVHSIMTAGNSTPKGERAALRKAIAEMENIARRHLLYKPDIAFSYQKNLGKRGQMDCVDESLNTTNYLKYLQAKGLLRHHKTHRFYAERGLIIDGRYPHKSARMRDSTGTDWAVDSWKGQDGAAPEIMLLSKWYRDRNSASNY
ncbi:MAG: hypothetical protein V3V02_01615 [Rhizobiaceae bacterium]